MNQISWVSRPYEIIDAWNWLHYLYICRTELLFLLLFYVWMYVGYGNAAPSSPCIQVAGSFGMKSFYMGNKEVNLLCYQTLRNYFN